MKISVIIPVYNEEKTVAQIVKRVERLPFKKEIIIVDDGSSDKTPIIIKKLSSPEITLISHAENRGKGAAIKTGLEKATGEIIVIQDADLEYYPEELPKLINPIIKREADVVYGSRFINCKHPVTIRYLPLYLGNRLLSLLTRLLFWAKITDMETGYKVFKSEILKEIKIRSNRFDFEPEITAKVLKRKVKFLELPISYASRTYGEGKKLTWKDGIQGFVALIKFRFSND